MAAPRIHLGDGKWFNPEAAESFEEATFHDGHNTISKATGSQWEHETLYRTPKKTWVIHRRGDWQGSRETYTIVPASQAHTWLIANDHGDDVPEDVRSGLEV